MNLLKKLKLQTWKLKILIRRKRIKLLIITLVTTVLEKLKNTNLYCKKKGDTLSAIALKYKTTVSNIQNTNNIANPNLIFIGQKIKSANDTISRTKTKYSVFK